MLSAFWVATAAHLLMRTAFAGAASAYDESIWLQLVSYIAQYDQAANGIYSVDDVLRGNNA